MPYQMTTINKTIHTVGVVTYYLDDESTVDVNIPAGPFETSFTSDFKPVKAKIYGAVYKIPEDFPVSIVYPAEPAVVSGTGKAIFTTGHTSDIMEIMFGNRVIR